MIIRAEFDFREPVVFHDTVLDTVNIAERITPVDKGSQRVNFIFWIVIDFNNFVNPRWQQVY